MGVKDLLDRASEAFGQAGSSNNKYYFAVGAILAGMAAVQFKKDKDAPKNPAPPPVVFNLPGVGTKPFLQEQPVVLTPDPEVKKIADEINELRRQNHDLVDSIQGASFAECRKTAAGKEVADTPKEYTTEISPNQSYKALNDELTRTKEKRYSLINSLYAEPKCQATYASTVPKEKLVQREISSETTSDSAVHGVR